MSENSWLQGADFASIDIGHLASYEDFVRFFDGYPRETLDEKMKALEQSKSEWCPWGIGVNMSTDFGMHVCREYIDKGTYSVLIQKLEKRKLLGFIPTTKSVDDYREGLSEEQMKEAVAEYYRRLGEKG